MASNRTIVIKGTGRYLEGTLTAVAVPPGTLMERDAGTANFQAQSTAEAAGTYPEKLIAVENSLTGDDVTTSWLASTRCQMYRAQSGDVVQLRLEDGEVSTIGAALTADGSTVGTVKVRDTATNPPFAYALEAVDALSDAASANLLVMCVIV